MNAHMFQELPETFPELARLKITKTEKPIQPDQKDGSGSNEPQSDESVQSE